MVSWAKVAICNRKTLYENGSFSFKPMFSRRNKKYQQDCLFTTDLAPAFYTQKQRFKNNNMARFQVITAT